MNKRVVLLLVPVFAIASGLMFLNWQDAKANKDLEGPGAGLVDEDRSEPAPTNVPETVAGLGEPAERQTPSEAGNQAIAISQTSKANLRLELVDDLTGLPPSYLWAKVDTPEHMQAFDGNEKMGGGPIATQGQPHPFPDTGVLIIEVASGIELSGLVRNDSATWHPGPSIPYTDLRFKSPPIPAGETHTISLRIKRKPGKNFFVRFVDVKTGQPLADVSLHTPNSQFSRGTGREKELWKLDQPWIRWGLELAASDAQGLMHVQYHQKRQTFEAHKKGYGPAWLSPNQNAPTMSEAVEVALSQTASLQGRINGQFPEGMEGLRIGVTGRPFDLADNAILGGTFDACVVTAQTPVALDGRFVLPDLPSTGPLSLWISHHDDLIHQPREKIVLNPGEIREWNWTFARGHDVEGFVLDENGDPHPKQHVWLSASKSTRTWELVGTHQDPEHKAVTDGNGLFRMENVPAGRYLIGQAPKRPFAHTKGQVIDVPHADQITLRPTPIGFVSGYVRHMGTPLKGVELSTYQVGENSQTTSDANGAFRLECFEGTDVYLSVQPYMQGGKQYVTTDFHRAKEGDTQVIIEMVLAGRMGLSAIDGISQKPMDALFSISPTNEAQGTMSTFPMRASWNPPFMVPGNYVGWAEAADGLIGCTEIVNLEPGDQGLERVVNLHPGGTIELANGDESKTVLANLYREDVRVYSTHLSGPKPSFKMVPGTYQLRLRQLPAKEYGPPQTVTVTAGETFVVERP